VSGCDLTSVLLFVLTIVVPTGMWWHRSRRLKRQNLPTEDELAEVEALRVPGSFRLSGRTSAPARHYEGTAFPLEGNGSAGSTGCHEPTFTESWRDRRSGA
ncbi:MAG: hypothetical protein MPN21_25785, partial [Thermoanaerobaculia bacterium]|nr:hypothetical protein [Thermoanaerobaculia bacterium]